MNHRSRICRAAALFLAVTGLFSCDRHETATGNLPQEKSSRAPLIGIASVNGEAYVRAIHAAGGVPVILPNQDDDPAAIDAYLKELDGLLLPGGADIPPAEYGEETHPTVEVLDQNRFRFEKAIGKAWIEKTKKPLLGICLGSQWISVLHGGSLVQDIPSEVGGNHRDTKHAVKLEPGTRLQQIYGDAEFEVNSFHHQSVDDAGKGLRIAARGADGVVEATETTDPERFLIGVQWHPEKMLPGDARQGRLLEAFVAAAK
ncbi:gamma-glutamyl-gamma-aminobutyrate hydrolase family protein [Luteolibacter luteus]|uniref:Gamma-glutamyl-gamma-aminobutyrate hydrolase family protein n=1 Tax=Luteolibacter luteus TaxID=2728835 RepID=A0A858RNG6_9BACT|nr:gamma-glutamyl-gamma-aminobutyrate hydrolase family protein [Luteolibacter luteus]QJE98966.1 gamma-glutamyl-gamma-aminobutyrate hydrolase family protein [Luteolibacter luteus]